jgi:hypothetical protein
MRFAMTTPHQSEPSLSPPEETTCGNLMWAIGAGGGSAVSSGLIEPERARGGGGGAEASDAGFDAGDAEDGG